MMLYHLWYQRSVRLSDSNTVQQKHRDHPDDLIEHGPKRRQFQRKVKQYRTEHQNGTDNQCNEFQYRVKSQCTGNAVT